jgi:hypothetical protein
VLLEQLQAADFESPVSSAGVIRKPAHPCLKKERTLLASS